MNVSQYLMIDLEIIKDITVNEKNTATVKFGLSLPHGVPWAEAEQICDDFKALISDMKLKQEQALEAQKKAQEELQAEVTPQYNPEPAEMSPQELVDNNKLSPELGETQPLVG